MRWGRVQVKGLWLQFSLAEGLGAWAVVTPLNPDSGPGSAGTLPQASTMRALQTESTTPHWQPYGRTPTGQEGTVPTKKPSPKP